MSVSLRHVIGYQRWTFHDLVDAPHALEIDGDGTLLIDGQAARIELHAPDEIMFVGFWGSVTCTATAFCTGFVGEGGRLTPEQVGRLLAEALLLWDQLRQWRLAFQAIQLQLTAPLAHPLRPPGFPSPSLATDDSHGPARGEEHFISREIP